MNIPMMMKVTKLIEKCPVCGDDTVGNGSKFIVEEETFERTCRECGWRITGKVKNDKVIIESDNREELAELLDARDKLCGFCENDACEKCQVTLLINDAYTECDELDE